MWGVCGESRGVGRTVGINQLNGQSKTVGLYELCNKGYKLKKKKGMRET